MTNKSWRVLRPRKHANPDTRYEVCVMCKEKVDREQDGHLTDYEGKTWCLVCGEIVIEEQLGDVKHEKDILERALMKLTIIRKECEK